MMAGRLAHWNRILGPGILIAAAAIGASHLVQSTRAGADYGFQLLWLILLVNLLKYPFFEFGPRYASATGETVLHGYERLGRGYLFTFLTVSFIAMLLSLAALIFVTGTLTGNLVDTLIPGDDRMISSKLPPIVWCIIVVVLCNSVLVFGRYNTLDRVTKGIVAILGLCTIIAVVVALANPVEPAADLAEKSIDLGDIATVGFLLALMGWMPAPIELSVWPSVWMAERTEQTGFTATVREARIDLNTGYIATTILACAFLMLGALMMHPTGESFSQNGAVFSSQLVKLFEDSISGWIGPVIAIAAFTCLFSTTLTCLDGYPRSNALAARIAMRSPRGTSSLFWVFNIVTIICALLFIQFLVSSMGQLVDVVTIIAFLTAPVFAYLNFRLVMSRHMPREHRPGIVMQVIAWTGMLFLTGVSIVYAYSRVRGWLG